MSSRIQLRRGSAAAWTSANPLLLLGEIGLETDTKKFKVGDGSNLWTGLPYFATTWADIPNLPSYLSTGGGQANGYATLDSNGRVPVGQLPNSVMEYKGTWDASANSPTLVDGTGSAGDVYRVTVANSSRNLGSGAIDFQVGDYVIYNGSTWEKSDTTDAVATVAGRTGNVTLTVADIGGNTTTALGVGSVELGHASDTTLTRVAAGVAAIEGNTIVVVGGAGHVDDMSIVAFGANTTRATGTGDFPFGIRMPRAVTITSVTYRCATADASGNLVVELRKNGSTVSGSSATIAAASQVTPGGTATGTWSFTAGDILTVYITAVGTTPGKGIIADLTAVTA